MKIGHIEEETRNLRLQFMNSDPYKKDNKRFIKL